MKRKPLGRLLRSALLVAAMILAGCTALPSTAEYVRTNPFAYTEGAQ